MIANLNDFVKVTDSLPKLNQKVMTFSTDFPEDGFEIEELIGNSSTNKSGIDWSKSYSVTHWKAV